MNKNTDILQLYKCTKASYLNILEFITYKSLHFISAELGLCVFMLFDFSHLRYLSVFLILINGNKKL